MGKRTREETHIPVGEHKDQPAPSKQAAERSPRQAFESHAGASASDAMHDIKPSRNRKRAASLLAQEVHSAHVEAEGPSAQKTFRCRRSSSSGSSSAESSKSSSKSSAPRMSQIQAKPGQLVRDIVKDYLQGLDDPEQGDHAVRRCASFISKESPIALHNRSKFVWVAKENSGHYTLNYEAAHGDPRDVASAGCRCDVCGQFCSKDRIFRVRCYRRRQADDPSEILRPREMRAEVYRLGRLCMQGLLGKAPVRPPSKEIRKRIRDALLPKAKVASADAKSTSSDMKASSSDPNPANSQHKMPVSVGLLTDSAKTALSDEGKITRTDGKATNAGGKASSSVHEIPIVELKATNEGKSGSIKVSTSDSVTPSAVPASGHVEAEASGAAHSKAHAPETAWTGYTSPSVKEKSLAADGEAVSTMSQSILVNSDREAVNSDKAAAATEQDETQELLKNWSEPLKHLKPSESKKVKELLQGELARIIEDCADPKAAWRQEGKKHVDDASRTVGVRTRAEGVAAAEERTYDEEDGGDIIEVEKDDDEGLNLTPKLEAFIRQPVAVFTPMQQSMLPLVASQKGSPHELYAQLQKSFMRPDYVIVLPSYGRPDRLQTHTLAFLKRQRIPQRRIEVWLAPGRAPGQALTEEERYRQALKKDWPNVRLRVGVKGIMEQRWHIGLQFPEGTHIVSLDDDVPDVFEKFKHGTSQDCLRQLVPGGFEALIHHAYDLMHREGAYIWGMSPSANPMNVHLNRISRKNGMINGFCYGWLVRHNDDLRSRFCSPTEDVERSCRVFHEDGVVLRYLMYCARTIFKAPQGIALLYDSAAQRKSAEEQAIRNMAREFPMLIEVRDSEHRRKTEAAMNFMFKKIGLGPLLPSGSPVERLPRPLKSPEERKTTLRRDSGDMAKKAKEEKMLLERCIALQDKLQEPGSSADVSSAPAAQPEVLRDIVALATGKQYDTNAKPLSRTEDEEGNHQRADQKDIPKSNEAATAYSDSLNGGADDLEQAPQALPSARSSVRLRLTVKDAVASEPIGAASEPRRSQQQHAAEAVSSESRDPPTLHESIGTDAPAAASSNTRPSDNDSGAIEAASVAHASVQLERQDMSRVSTNIPPLRESIRTDTSAPESLNLRSRAQGFEADETADAIHASIRPDRREMTREGVLDVPAFSASASVQGLATPVEFLRILAGHGEHLEHPHKLERMRVVTPPELYSSPAGGNVTPPEVLASQSAFRAQTLHGTNDFGLPIERIPFTPAASMLRQDTRAGPHNLPTVEPQNLEQYRVSNAAMRGQEIRALHPHLESSGADDGIHLAPRKHVTSSVSQTPWAEARKDDIEILAVRSNPPVEEGLQRLVPPSMSDAGHSYPSQAPDEYEDPEDDMRDSLSDADDNELMRHLTAAIGSTASHQGDDEEWVLSSPEAAT